MGLLPPPEIDPFLDISRFRLGPVGGLAIEGSQIHTGPTEKVVTYKWIFFWVSGAFLPPGDVVEHGSGGEFSAKISKIHIFVLQRPRNVADSGWNWNLQNDPTLDPQIDPAPQCGGQSLRV